MEMQVKYVGDFRITIATTATISKCWPMPYRQTGVQVDGILISALQTLDPASNPTAYAWS